MVNAERAGGGCMVNLAPHFVDLFLRSTGAKSATVTAALSSALHQRSIEDFASLTLSTTSGSVASIQVGYAFPDSPLKRHCAFMRIGADGTATVWSDGRTSFTSAEGTTETGHIDVDSDPLYGEFVSRVAEELDRGICRTAGDPRPRGGHDRHMGCLLRVAEKGQRVTTPSIEDVAMAAGVHKSTVSRAFSRPEAVKLKHGNTSSGWRLPWATP